MLSRGIEKQEFLVSFTSREVVVKAMENTLRDENFPGLEVIPAYMPWLKLVSF